MKNFSRNCTGLPSPLTVLHSLQSRPRLMQSAQSSNHITVTLSSKESPLLTQRKMKGQVQCFQFSLLVFAQGLNSLESQILVIFIKVEEMSLRRGLKVVPFIAFGEGKDFIDLPFCLNFGSMSSFLLSELQDNYFFSHLA